MSDQTEVERTIDGIFCHKCKAHLTSRKTATKIIFQLDLALEMYVFVCEKCKQDIKEFIEGKKVFHK